MAKQKYLTKSRFKVGYECPTRLYYYEHDEYGSVNHENAFLDALAQGGFQVGALAKLYYPGGIDLEGHTPDEAIAKTNELLKQERVTIFEAALQTGPFRVYVDILVKTGNSIELIEVKSKSYDFTREDFFKKRDPGIDSGWEPYVVDVAFQYFVANKFNPKWKITPYLFLADTSKAATVTGLHQLFLITKKGERSSVKLNPKAKDFKLGAKILRAVDVSEEVKYVIEEDSFQGTAFVPYVENLAKHLLADSKIETRVASHCKACEFRIGTDQKTKKKSGFDECWLAEGRLAKENLHRPLIFDLWNFRKSQDCLVRGTVHLDELEREDIDPKSKSKESSKPGLSNSERQWLQVEYEKLGRRDPYIDTAGLEAEISKFKWPLHMIDFETSMVAIPFHKGRRPYEQLAFQFSHHVLHKDGRVEHRNQFLFDRIGEFPNFEFLRALRKSLSADDGTIFRYADHENTVLKQIRRQIEATPPEDSKELLAFIAEVTSPSEDERKEGATPGTRAMVDLKKLGQNYYYHPMTKGSNSIKKVCPAVLADSEFLKTKYSKTKAGKTSPVSSLNLDDWTWIQFDEAGNVRDPYKLLPSLFEDIDERVFEEGSRLFGDDALNDGGAAMTAWARMQFTEMSAEERTAISNGLLRYCELDTLSMVWLVEYFLQKIEDGRK